MLLLLLYFLQLLLEPLQLNLLLVQLLLELLPLLRLLLHLVYDVRDVYRAHGYDLVRVRLLRFAFTWLRFDRFWLKDLFWAQREVKLRELL